MAVPTLAALEDARTLIGVLQALADAKPDHEALLADLEQRIRSEVTAVTGLGLVHVILTPPGGVEKSTSGKLARGPTRRRYADALGIEA